MLSRLTQGKNLFRQSTHHLPMHHRQSIEYQRSVNLIGTWLIFESLFESKWKCKYLKISTLTVQLVPRLFAQLEKCSCDYIIPLDVNEFLFARHMFQLLCKVTHFSQKNVQNMLLFYSSSQRIEYDSNNFAGICISVAVLRQSLIAARTSSITSDASWCSIM